MSMTNPEIDLLIIDSLDFDFKSIADISIEVQIDEDDVKKILADLIKQGIAIDKKGDLYRMPQLGEDLEFEDE